MGEWVTAALALFLSFLVLISPVACTMYESKLIGQAAARGEDPLRMACSMSYGRSPVCQKLQDR